MKSFCRGIIILTVGLLLQELVNTPAFGSDLPGVARAYAGSRTDQPASECDADVSRIEKANLGKSFVTLTQGTSHVPTVADKSSDCCTTTACESDCDDDCCRLHRTGAFGEYLYLKVRGADLIFGQLRDGCDPFSAPRGSLGLIQPDYASGVRAGINLACTDCSSIELSGTWWEMQSHADLFATGTDVISSTLTLFNTLSCDTTSQAAAAAYSYQLQMADVLFKQVVCGDCNYVVNWLGGARYARFEQEMASRFSIIGTTSVDTDITFDAGGIRTGLDGEARIGGCGLSVYSRGTVSLLAAHFKANYSQANTFAGNQGFVNYDSDRIVPVLDLELGVGWTACSGKVRVGIGYYVSSWFNAVITPDFIQAVQFNDFTTNVNNLRNWFSLDGAVGRVEFRF